MSKLKVKCASCGKVFAPSNAKQTRCPDCEKELRVAKAQKRAESSTPAQAQQPSAPLIQGPGASVLRPDMAHMEVAAAERMRADEPPATTPKQPQPSHTQPEPRPVAPRRKSSHSGAHGRSRAKGQHAAPPQFTLTDELRRRIEARYLELASPVEFDGIRTQIAAELGAPKPVVRTVVRELRARRGMPSWWEAQGFSGSSVDLARIKAAYTAYLPLPPVGIHREIAEELGVEPRIVYRGIRKIRAQMGLPQYNAPDSHDEGTVIVALSAGESAAQPAS
jgi:hypothetical protein